MRRISSDEREPKDMAALGKSESRKGREREVKVE
jgi:hypothetical protein